MRKKKSSYINQREANQLINFYIDQIQDDTKAFKSCAIVSLFRTQSHCLRDEMTAIAKKLN